MTLTGSRSIERPGQRVVHSMQTNGTLLDDEWGQFLAKENFLVGLSVDGPAHLHDAYRVNKAGRGTHAQVVRGWDVLRRHGVETNILCTVNAANADHGAEVYRYFRDELGATFLQFIPIVERVPIDVEPLDLEIAMLAAAVRARHRSIKLPDALVIATASHIDADHLITTDRTWPPRSTLKLRASISEI